MPGVPHAHQGSVGYPGPGSYPPPGGPSFQPPYPVPPAPGPSHGTGSGASAPRPAYGSLPPAPAPGLSPPAPAHGFPGNLIPTSSPPPPYPGAPPPGALPAARPQGQLPQSNPPAAPSNPTPVGQPIPTPLGPQIGAPQNPSGNPAAGPKRRLRWPGIVFPLLFLTLAAVIVWLVLDLSEMFHSYRVPPPVPVAPVRPGSDPAPPNARARALAAARNQAPERPEPSRIAPAEHAIPARRVEPVRNEQPPHPPGEIRVAGEVPLPPAIDLSDESADTPAGPDPEPLGEADNAAGILSRFLAARTLDQRRPFLSESTRSDKELAQSCLAGPLPPVIHQRNVHYMEDQSEQHREQFFEVAFQNTDDSRPTHMLVQLAEWGDGRFRVHADAFIDLFEDTLGRFAARPVEGSRTFHVVADAYKHCFDDGVPEPERKSFIKLRSHPRLSPRIKAYFDRQSDVAGKIAQPDGLPWGSSGICTVTVKWNTANPSLPFVELVRLDGFTWNP